MLYQLSYASSFGQCPYAGKYTAPPNAFPMSRTILKGTTTAFDVQTGVHKTTGT
jgi:hypothetical protein